MCRGIVNGEVPLPSGHDPMCSEDLTDEGTVLFINPITLPFPPLSACLLHSIVCQWVLKCKMLSYRCTCGVGGGAVAPGCDDTLWTVLAHLHHLGLQQRCAPLHCVLRTKRNQAADVRGTPGGQTH